MLCAGFSDLADDDERALGIFAVVSQRVTGVRASVDDLDRWRPQARPLDPDRDAFPPPSLLRA